MDFYWECIKTVVQLVKVKSMVIVDNGDVGGNQAAASFDSCAVSECRTVLNFWENLSFVYSTVDRVQ